MHVSIRIQGHPDASWQQWLEHLQIVHEEGGTSRLSGTLPDQAALFGVLNKLDSLGLTLFSLERNETLPSKMIWKATLLQGDLGKVLPRLKQEAGQDILLYRRYRCHAGESGGARREDLDTEDRDPVWVDSSLC